MSEILSACPKPGEGVHYWLLSAAHQCRKAGLTKAEAEALIAVHMTRPPKANEVRDAVEKGYSPSVITWTRPAGSTCQAGSEPAQPIAPVPISEIKFDPAELAAVANRITMPPNWRHWFWERSPVMPTFQSGFSFLAHLYEDGERVHVFDIMQSSKPLHTVTIGRSMDCRVPDRIRQGGSGAGIWFLCNPVDGISHHNPRQDNKPSCRSEESITSFRYAVLESDCADSSEWFALIAQLPLRIAAIYTSGSRSIHSLIRVDASSKEHWDSIIGPMKRPLKVLGCDSGCLSAVRLTRLPGCHRPEKGGFQKLLYLAPKPVETPLLDLPKISDRDEQVPNWKAWYARRKGKFGGVQ